MRFKRAVAALRGGSSAPLTLATVIDQNAVGAAVCALEGRASVSAMRDAARGRERALAFFVPHTEQKITLVSMYIYIQYKE